MTPRRDHGRLYVFMAFVGLLLTMVLVVLVVSRRSSAMERQLEQASVERGELRRELSGLKTENRALRDQVGQLSGLVTGLSDQLLSAGIEPRVPSATPTTTTAPVPPVTRAAVPPGGGVPPPTTASTRPPPTTTTRPCLVSIPGRCVLP